MADSAPPPPSPPRGLLIVFEGLDRSGKSTQCTLLHSSLLSAGHKVQHLRFPDRTTPTGTIISSYLSSSSSPALSDHAIHLLFSANRWEAAPSMLSSLATGTTLLVDRYSYSGAVYSAAKRNPELGLEWAWAPEVGLPEPDLVVYLTVEEGVQVARGGFGEERYEKVEMQREVRALFGGLWGRVGRKGGDEKGMGTEIKVISAEGAVEEVQGLVKEAAEESLGDEGRRRREVGRLGPLV